MTDSATTAAETAPDDGDGASRRDFLLIMTSTVGAVGTALAAWPLVDSMNPAADTLALASTEVDISPIEEGQSLSLIHI